MTHWSQRWDHPRGYAWTSYTPIPTELRDDPEFIESAYRYLYAQAASEGASIDTFDIIEPPLSLELVGATDTSCDFDNLCLLRARGGG